MRRLAFFLAVLIAAAPLSAQEVLSPEKEHPLFKLPEGFAVELVAAEPAVVNPVTMALDEAGRLYIAESHTYRYGPKGSPVESPTNPIVRLDRAADGKTWKRTVVAEGFEDPVMGLLIRDGKMWCTSNDHLYLYDLDAEGKGTRRRELVLDKNKAWNPFGMFVLEWGPDGLLYVSVGNHNIQLVGPTNQMTSRGNSGIVVRMKPDGSDMEKLVQGLRVPYSFEYDPFGQLWLLSNGQGNPDRFVKVIEGVDYHMYSRKVDNVWLAGKNPLAPPCFETPSGAGTQLLHYYGAMFPESYQGRQFGVNWGPHGTGTRNHVIEEFVPDERERITRSGDWLSSADPRFRPTQLLMAPDGGLLLADWYGRDDESDLTGRIWKVTYTGADRPTGATLTDAQKRSPEGLGSRNPLDREFAVRALSAEGNKAVAVLASEAAKAARPMAAANALWALVRIGTPEAKAALADGAKHADWKVRRLALRLLRRFEVPQRDTVAAAAAKDADPAVRLEAALARSAPANVRNSLLDVLTSDAVADPHLRYEAAWRLARHADVAAFERLLRSDKADARLGGMIALDVAMYEGFDSKDAARKALVAALNDPKSLDLDSLFQLAFLHPAPEMIKPLQASLTRPDLSATALGLASRVLIALGGLKGGAANPWLEGVKSGKIKPTDPGEKLTLVELLSVEGPSPFALDQLTKLVAEKDVRVAAAARMLARSLGREASAVAEPLWAQLSVKGTKPDVRIDILGTLAAIEKKADVKRWGDVLAVEPSIVKEAVRDLRVLPRDAALTEMLVKMTPALIRKDESLRPDLAMTLKELGVEATTADRLGLRPAPIDKPALTAAVLEDWSKGVAAERIARGRQSFLRASCVKCHGDRDDRPGPPLASVGKKEPAYVVEAILEPSKILLTGYETEQVTTVDGRTLNGLVKQVGDDLIVSSADAVTKVPKAKVDAREIQKKSLMPDGLEQTVSREELIDLVAYLMSLKAEPSGPK